MGQPSLFHIYLIRFLYLLLFAGLSIQFWPLLFGPISSEAVYESFVSAILSALALVSFIGIIAPLRMLPVLLFEIVWKLIWLASVAFPRWQSDNLTDDFAMQLFAIGMVAPFVVIFPWRYFIATVRNSVDRWTPQTDGLR